MICPKCAIYVRPADRFFTNEVQSSPPLTKRYVLISNFLPGVGSINSASYARGGLLARARRCSCGGCLCSSFSQKKRKLTPTTVTRRRAARRPLTVTESPPPHIDKPRPCKHICNNYLRCRALVPLERVQYRSVGILEYYAFTGSLHVTKLIGLCSTAFSQVAPHFFV